jgi:NAD(P)-dependent dehydrogenase (short-subunit alcohol dehydrogenase family)
VTSGAVAVGDEGLRDLTQAAVWGLVRSAQSEHPDRFVLVDVDDPDTEIPSTDEPQIALRNGKAYAPRLARDKAPETTEPVFDPDGTVLVTGGSGTLGGLVARHLVSEHGVRHVILASRSGRISPHAEGLDVTSVACDVADRDALAALLAGLEHPLTGIVHTAGQLDDGLIETLTTDQIDRVLRPKVTGALNLHELTQDLNLGAFVLFSSAATTFGAPGQANYAAANAWLDALAHQRRERGLAAVSMAWGLWAERSGLTGTLTDSDLARMARGGTTAMPTEDALTLFEAALRGDHPVMVTAKMNGELLREHAESGALPPLMRGLVRTATRKSVTANESAALAALPEPERKQRLLSLVRGHAASVLGYESADLVQPARAFKDLGFDSLVAVEFRNRLAAATGLRLRATLVFDHPTPAALAEQLAGQFTGQSASRSSEESTRESRPTADALVAELERMADMLDAMGDTDRERISGHLQALMVRAAAPAPTEHLLPTASDDELFAFIDNQLGS